MFGGLISSLENTNQVNCYDFTSQSWRLVDLKRKEIQPAPMDSQSIALDSQKKRAILFGGFQNLKTEVYSSKVWSFDLVEHSWELLEPKNNQHPHPRRNSHIAYDQDKIYMFGGTNCDTKFDDFWTFDLSTLIWTRIKPQGINPDVNQTNKIVFNFIYP